ncbi:MAG: hypothetical protein A2V90_00460 [Gammaproteobacteria bacterium RBG_16_57_12]|nr:MAG: hypothetical protein A2V90_00460 [Gammaproteobacteria bacterium RBG_16_57_12]
MQWKYLLLSTFLACSFLSINVILAQPLGAGASDQSTSSLPGEEPILPLPLTIAVNPDKVNLGLRMFEDKRLSRDGSIACRSCHYLDKGGADHEPYSRSIDGGLRSTNTPSIFNLAYADLYGWYGMRSTLGDLAEAIIKSPQGLASDWPAIMYYLEQDPRYLASFKRIYPDGIQPANIKDALSEYMRSLITPNARFDRYLRGEANAISAGELEGYRLFKEYGCASCHQGINIGANMNAPYDLFRGDLNQNSHSDEHTLGRYNKTGLDADKYIFRVPSLRNVAQTAPYFHDGSAEDLEDAIDAMSHYMLGREMPTADRKKIAMFLRTLSGEWHGKPL